MYVSVSAFMMKFSVWEIFLVSVEDVRLEHTQNRNV